MVTLPMLFLHGELDGFAPPKTSYQMAAVNGEENSTVLVIPGAGHIGAPFETEKIDEALLAFIGSCPP